MNRPKPRTKAGLIDADGPEARLCAVTRAEKNPDDLIRFVAGPDGTIVPDLSRNLPGRGIWISLSKTIVQTATVATFSKSLKSQIKIPADLADLIERLMLDRTRAALSFAKKAGLVTAGYMKVDQVISAQEAVALVQASDGADDGIDRLARKFQGIGQMYGRLAPIVRELTSDDLGLAIGRANVIHAALAEGGQTQKFLGECNRLKQYRLGRSDDKHVAPDQPIVPSITSSAD